MFNFDRNMVTAAFKVENKRASAASEQELVQYDAALFARLGRELLSQARANGIPVDRFSLSMLAFYAVCSPGRGARARVELACQYFESVRPQQPSELFHLANTIMPPPDAEGDGHAG